jgi:hypothetical protein
MGLSGMRLAVERTIVAVAMILLAAFDLAFDHADTTHWVGKPVRGLAAWGGSVPLAWQRSDGLLSIVVQNVLSLGAILLGLWVARRIFRRRADVLVRMAIMLILVLSLINVLGTLFMVRVIIGYGAPNG